MTALLILKRMDQMELYKKTGTVLTGKITGTLYLLRKKKWSHEVNIMRIVGSKNGLTLDKISSHGTTIPDTSSIRRDNEIHSSTFRNQSHALKHVQYLEEEYSNSKEYIENIYTSGLLAKEEYKEKLSLANA